MSRKEIVLILALAAALNSPAPGAQKIGASSLTSLLPQVANWKAAEGVQRYGPETLYEFIDGAAEAYISYDFKELIVAEFQGGRTKTSLTTEIYDMGSELNAFGIYSAERFSESRFIPIGVQGYLEEGTLNFLAGRYYVKLMCYEGGGQTEGFLKLFAEAIVDKINNPGGFPVLLRAFPKDGLVANSEKFILRNVMGFKFLKNGFIAGYRQAGQEFDAFLIDGRTADEADAMLKQYLDNFIKSGQAADKRSYGVHVKDAYLKHVFVAKAGSYICGVTKIKDGQDALGEKVLAALVNGLKK
ncbi:MAG: hypothetical protein NTU60_03855 [Candidatus Aminicenantes bacterium]|nr:hypothetical protein [Candidatus Aminicenantes bacterium]